MEFTVVWRDLRDRCASLSPESVLVTPTSERAFDVVTTRDDRIDIRFRETEEERALWRHQFTVLYDRLADDATGISLDDLPTGVEPYVSVLSLTSAYEVDASTNQLRPTANGTNASESQSPFLKSEWDVRTAPERVHDDALLLADQLERLSLEDLTTRSVDSLVDVYVLLSDVQRGANRLRRRVGEVLLGRIGPDDRVHGQFGTVRRTSRERRHLKDRETVFDVLDDRGIPHDWVVGVDRDKLDVVLTVTDIEPSEVYDIEDQVYVQKIDVEEDAKRSRFQGLAEQLDTLEGEEAMALQRDLEQLETRLEDLLATS